MLILNETLILKIKSVYSALVSIGTGAIGLTLSKKNNVKRCAVSFFDCEKIRCLVSALAGGLWSEATFHGTLNVRD